jgi:hypothetical protein
VQRPSCLLPSAALAAATQHTTPVGPYFPLLPLSLYTHARIQPWVRIFQRLWVCLSSKHHAARSQCCPREDVRQQGDEAADVGTGRSWKDKYVSLFPPRSAFPDVSFAAILYKLKLNQSVTTIPTGASAPHFTSDSDSCFNL